MLSWEWNGFIFVSFFLPFTSQWFRTVDILEVIDNLEKNKAPNIMILKTRIYMPNFSFKNRSGSYWSKCLCPFDLIQNRLFSKTIEAKKSPKYSWLSWLLWSVPFKTISWKLLWLGRTTLSGALCITSSSPTRKFTLFCIPFDKNSNGSPIASLWEIASSVQLICFDYLPSVITAYCHPSPHLTMKKNI